MATENECKGLRVLDPVQGLIDYINTVKPFHTKIVEVLVEYVYDEVLDTSVLEDLDFEIEMTRLLEEEFASQCQGGFSFVPWGGPRGWPVLSPNQNVAFEDYPAVDPVTNTIILPGDRSLDFDTGDVVELLSHIDDTTGLCEIVDMGPNHFIVNDTSIHGNSFVTVFTGYLDPVYTSGVPLDDERGFVITAITPDTPTPGLTRVDVQQNVVNPVPIGHFGLIKLLGDNIGTFTVSDIEFREGSPDYYQIPLDDFSVLLGDDPYTVVTLVEPLNPLSGLGPNQSHGMQLRVPAIEINKVLSYSNIANLPTNTPDEGYITRDVVGVTVSTLDGLGLPIPDTGKFVVPGNLSESNIFAGEWVRISQSTGNNGVYTITSLAYDSFNDETTIGVSERVRDMTADGIARIDVPANMFFVDGDYTGRFRQGTGFNVSGGTYHGNYMVLYSDFVNGKTRIRTSEEIINVGKGYAVKDVPATNQVSIDRDKTGQFVAGFNINIVNSSVNDGMYEIVTSTYDALNDSTIIEVVEDILEPTIDGEVFFSTMGFIKEVGLGFGEGTDFCSYHPASHITVRFDEELEIEGLSLTLHNHLIAYNLENDDWWGFDTPIHTQYNAAAPTVTEAAVAPGSPGTNDFWFNTDEGQLYYWSVSDVWIPVKTIYWLDTTTNLFHYRTMYDRQNSTTIGDKTRVDTGWTQLFANPPGFADVQPSDGTFNAHVTSFDSDPHTKSFNNITTTAAHTNMSYTIPGGNYIHRLGPETRLEMFEPASFVEFTEARSFEIYDVDFVENEIRIPGIVDWFFTPGMIMGVRIWNDTYHEFVVVDSQPVPPPDYGSVVDPVSASEDYGSVADPATVFEDYGLIIDLAGETLIELAPADIALFQGLSKDYGTVHGAVFNPTYPKETYMLPGSGVINPLIHAISYNWVEPHKIHTLTTDATIKENFKIDWGSAYAWKIVATDSGAGEITVYGDISSFLDTTNKMFITQSRGIDGQYEIASYVVNVSGPGPTDTETVITFTTALPTDPAVGHFGFAQIEDSSVVNWFQFMIISANSTTNEFLASGDVTFDIPNGGQFRVVGTLNDGTYTATATPIYDGVLDQSTIQVASIGANDTGGWIEHV